MARCLLPLTLALLLAPVPAPAQGEMVITKPGTPLYHWPGCPLIRDPKDVLAMTRAQAEARVLKPHDACDPSREPPPPKLPMVYIDEAGKDYHREKCEELGEKSRRVTVDEAVRKKHWPCRVCKPPIRPRTK